MDLEGDSVKSRMEKYYQNSDEIGRVKKNKELYDASSGELEEFSLSSNASVIGVSSKDIDVDKIREMLDYKYRDEPKRKSIAVIPDDKTNPSLPKLAETKEYDINTILQKARGDKESDYEVDRRKKLRNTQYDILKKLELNPEEDDEDGEPITEEAKNLLELINTITHKELAKDVKKESENLDPLDILADLKGDDNTQVIEPINLTNKLDETIKEVIKEEVQNQVDKTFFTNSNTFTKSDFDDFNDLKEDVKSNSFMIKILIIIIMAVLAIGVFVLIRSIIIP